MDEREQVLRQRINLQADKVILLQQQMLVMRQQGQVYEALREREIGVVQRISDKKRRQLLQSNAQFQEKLRMVKENQRCLNQYQALCQQLSVRVQELQTNIREEESKSQSLRNEVGQSQVTLQMKRQEVKELQQLFEEQIKRLEYQESAGIQGACKGKLQKEKALESQIETLKDRKIQIQHQHLALEDQLFLKNQVFADLENDLLEARQQLLFQQHLNRDLLDQVAHSRKSNLVLLEKNERVINNVEESEQSVMAEEAYMAEIMKQIKDLKQNNGSLSRDIALTQKHIQGLISQKSALVQILEELVWQNRRALRIIQSKRRL